MNHQDSLSAKQFTEFTRINESELRFFEKTNLFQPEKLGKDGFRVYSAPQTASINAVNVLHSMRIPAKKIQKLVEDRSPESVLSLLR